MPVISPTLARFAHDQHGYVTAPQLQDCGFTPASIKWAVQTGVLHRSDRGVYALGHVPRSREGRWSAAVLGAGHGASLAGIAAAQLYGVTRRRSSRIDVAVPMRRRPRPGAHLLTLSGLEHGDSCTYGGISVLVFPVLCLQLAAQLPVAEMANVVHEADFHDLVHPLAIERVLHRPGRWAGRDTLWRALEMNLADEAGTMSRFEHEAVDAIARLGLDRPSIGACFTDAEGSFSPDLWWRDRGLVAELDGFGHRRRRTRREDESRDRRLRAADVRVIRIGIVPFRLDQRAALAPLLAAFTHCRSVRT